MPQVLADTQLPKAKVKLKLAKKCPIFTLKPKQTVKLSLLEILLVSAEILVH